MLSQNLKDKVTNTCYGCGKVTESCTLMSTTEDGGPDPCWIKVPVCEDCHAWAEEHPVMPDGSC